MNKIIIQSSTIKNGSMKQTDKNHTQNMDAFLRECKLNKKNLVTMSQVHSSNVTMVTENEKEKRIPECDGLLTKDKNVILATVTADCVPFMVYDEKKCIYGAVHAGYKGIINGVVEETIQIMKHEGADEKNIKATLGPSINSCCYAITKERAETFQNTFEHARKALETRNGQVYIELKKIITEELLRLGVKKDNITSVHECTKCGNNYYSFRRDFENTGLFASIITAV